MTRKAAEAADKADARRKHQREWAATRKAVETADQADAHRMRKKPRKVWMLPSMLLLLKQRRA